MNLRTLFGALTPPTVPKNRRRSRRNNLKAAVTLSASGNVLLLTGRYKTADDISREKRKLSSF